VSLKIRQTVKLSGVSPDQLFDAYLDPKRHGAVTGSRVRISRDVGGAFSAFDGEISGRNLLIVPSWMVVQSWRSKKWKKTDPDSVLILAFGKTKKGARIELVQTNVPGHDLRGVDEGWKKYYWTPWKAYLKKRS
jgi:activator of HSP90 ATPase